MHIFNFSFAFYSVKRELYILPNLSVLEFLDISHHSNDIKKKVSDLETRLQKSKLNVEKIQTLMNTWKDTPLFKRPENAKTTLLQLDDRQTRLDNRYKEIKDTSQKIHDLVKV